MTDVIIVKEAQGREDIKKVAELADIIWHEHFPKLLSAEQIDYMVDKFQSYNALVHAVEKEGYRYYMAYEGDELCGYLGFRDEGDGNVFISKVYVRADKRRCGAATRMLERLRTDLPEAKRWYLTVNKYNEIPIAAYKKRGFSVASEQVTDIGSGFVMDDYVMEKLF